MGRIEDLKDRYESHVSMPWDRTLAGPQRVWFAVYDKADERRLRARLGDLQVALPALQVVARQDHLLVELASPAELGRAPRVDPATADVSPAGRAKIVRAFVDGAGGLESAGYCRTDHWTGSFANSAGGDFGLSAWEATTMAAAS